MKEILEAAIEAKKNDVNSYVWKFSKQSGQEDIKLIDATEEQLKQFYEHCTSMLYSKDKRNPGRYVLLDIIKNYRNKCTTEIYLKQLELGAFDNKPYSRILYCQDLLDTIKNNDILKSELKNISIAALMQGLPREYERLSIQMILDGCQDMLGYPSFKHVTYNFIFGLGLYLTPEEMKDLVEKDVTGKTRNRMTVIKERLFIRKDAVLKMKSSGLSYHELKTILELKALATKVPRKYSSLTIDELVILRDKIFFRLEQEVSSHAELWERKLFEIKKVAEVKGYTLDE